MITFKEFIKIEEARRLTRSPSRRGMSPLGFAIASTASNLLSTAAMSLFNSWKQKKAEKAASETPAVIKADEQEVKELEKEYKSVALNPAASKQLLRRITDNPLLLDEPGTRQQVNKILDALSTGLIPVGKKWTVLSGGEEKFKLISAIRAVVNAKKFKNDADRDDKFDTIKNYIEILTESNDK